MGNMRDWRPLILGGAATVLLAGLVATLLPRLRTASAQGSEKTPSAEEGAGEVSKTVLAEESPAVGKPERKLVPGKPEDYGMLAYSEADEPKTQEQWDKVISDRYNHLRAASPRELEQATTFAATTPETLSKHMAEVDEKIREFEKQLETEPGDRRTAERLQDLRILKALGKAMHEDVATLEETPTAEEETEIQAGKEG